MNYLQPSEYEIYGLDATTPLALVGAASALINSHCRRAALTVMQYEERLRLTSGRNTIRLSYLPLAVLPPATTPIVSVRGRFATPRRGEWPFSDMSWEIAVTFGLPGAWSTVNPSEIDVSSATGELTFPINAVGLGFSELDVAYTAGFAELPEAVKFACAQIVRNAQATPALNVRSETIDRMRLDYFADSLMDKSVATLLAPYVAQKAG